MAQPRLKACPFCGTPGAYGRGGQPWEEARMWTAGCPLGHVISPDMETISEAAQWWNRRDAPRRQKRPALTAQELQDALQAAGRLRSPADNSSASLETLKERKPG